MLMLLRKHKTLILLLLIFGFALLLRLYKLGTLPSNFHEDEVLSGYIGRYIVQNGRDTYGNLWPFLYFNKFGDYYIILPIYLSGLATYLFGINEFATRFPAALLGALAIIPVFILAFFMFKNKTIALLSAFFSAILPWQIVLARSTTEGIIGSSLFLFGVVGLIYSIKKQNNLLLILTSIIFLITYDIYHPFRLYVPLILLPLLVLFKSHIKKKKYLLTYVGIMILFFALTVYISTTFWGKGRFVQTSILSPVSGVSIKLNELIFSEGQNHRLLARAFHNKVIGYGKEFINQYLTYFSPQFLFVDGWKNSRYYVPEQGLLYLSLLILLFTAILPIKIKQPLKIDKITAGFLFYLLFLAPVPAAITFVESPNVHRSVLLSYIIVIFSAYGFYKLLQVQYKKIPLIYGLIFLLIGEFIFFWHQYTRHMDLYSSIKRNDGQKQISLYIGEKSKSYDEIILPAEAAMSWYYLFYNKDFSTEYIGRFRLDARIDQTKKIRYIENSCPTNALNGLTFNKKILVVDRFSCTSSDQFKQIDQIIGVNPLMTYRVLVPNKQ